MGKKIKIPTLASARETGDWRTRAQWKRVNRRPKAGEKATQFRYQQYGSLGTMIGDYFEKSQTELIPKEERTVQVKKKKRTISSEQKALEEAFQVQFIEKVFSDPDSEEYQEFMTQSVKFD